MPFELVACVRCTETRPKLRNGHAGLLAPFQHSFLPIPSTRAYQRFLTVLQRPW